MQNLIDSLNNYEEPKKKNYKHKMVRQYTKKDGTISIYEYDNRENIKKYSKKCNKNYRKNHPEICKLQKRKYYYKKINNIEKIKEIENLIKKEKEREKERIAYEIICNSNNNKR